MPEQTKVKYIARLTPEVYADIERQVLAPTVNTNTTDLMAGYMLGVQAILKILREGYVAENSNRS